MRTPLAFTIVVALDARTLGQFRATWPTWRALKPELLDFNWLVIADGFAGSPEWWREQLEDLELPPHRLILWSWPQRDDKHATAAITQRERMLTAFVRVPPACVTTSHWIKVDTDVIATRRSKWIERSWFRGSAVPAMVASPWGYSKPPDILHRLQRWADRHPNSLLRQTAPLSLPELQEGMETMPLPRIASWLCIVELGFSKLAAQLMTGDRLPVPSQDTYHWYLATRLGIPIRRHNFKRGGWETIHSDRRRAERIKGIFGEELEL